MTWMDTVGTVVALALLVVCGLVAAASTVVGLAWWLRRWRAKRAELATLAEIARDAQLRMVERYDVNNKQEREAWW